MTPMTEAGERQRAAAARKGRRADRTRHPPNKAARDRDRKRGWGNWNKGARWKTFPIEEYNRLLKTGVAKSTLRSRMARLKTWDRAMAELEAQEAIKPLDDPSFLTPERAGAGVALLRARGYRSAELYLSTALTRHKKLFPLSIQLDLAAKDATRIAKRGRGPAKGKAPIPHLGQWDFRPLMTGIWFLLRISELKALNVADVKVRWGPRQRWQLALEVASSKTDQQGQGATVARDCVCPSERQSEYCPVHLLWEHSLARKEWLRTTGVVNGSAPLFTDEMGHRITEARIQAAVERVAAAAGEPLETQGARGSERTASG